MASFIAGIWTLPLWLSLALMVPQAAQASAYFCDSAMTSACEPAHSSTMVGLAACFFNGPPTDDFRTLSVEWDEATGACVTRTAACGVYRPCPANRQCLTSCKQEPTERLLLSIRAGVGLASFDLLESPASSNGSELYITTGTALPPSVFRSEALDQLPSLTPTLPNKEIVLKLYANSSVVVKLVFDLSQSPETLTRTNWLALNRLKSSWPVTNLSSYAPFRFFAARGDYVPSSPIARNFFICYYYIHCGADAIFMVALDINDPCSTWGSVSSPPKFIYTPEPNVPVETHGRLADSMTIILR